MHGNPTTVKASETEEDEQRDDEENQRHGETNDIENAHVVMKVIYRNTISVVRPGLVGFWVFVPCTIF